MKDYSKFFKSAYGFVKKYDIVDDQVCVYSAKSKKGEPQEYPASKEMIAYFDERLGEQYKAILKNRNIVKDQYMEKNGKIVNCISWILYAISVVVGLVLSFLNSAVLPFIAGLVIGSLIKSISPVVMEELEKRFDMEMDTMQEYMDKRAAIEKANDLDINVTNYLKDKTVAKINKNVELKRNGLIENSFNIDLMDKVELKELRKMLERYRISSELGKKDGFVVPEKYKKKTRKKD